MWRVPDQYWVSLYFLTLTVDQSEPPAVCPVQLRFPYLEQAVRMFTSLVSCDSVFVCLSMFVDSGLLCGLTSLKDIRRFVIFILFSFLLEQLVNFEDPCRLLWVQELF